MNPNNHRTIFNALPETLPLEFWIITACDPGYQAGSDPFDRRLDEELRGRLKQLGQSTPKRIIRVSPDESHAWPGWVVECTEEDALKLGRDFRQKDLFQVSEDYLQLVEVSSRKKHPLNSFSERLRDPRQRRLFQIYVGSPFPRGRFLHTEALAIRLRTAQRFPSFTISSCEGNFRDQVEETAVITVATYLPNDVLALAEDLRQLFDQEGVGVSHHGIYQRVTAWSDQDFLLQCWGIQTFPDHEDVD